ncbi:c-type cytochrome [Dankookia sp. GCM10030260]|uniref:c-type cytochrome n=1 Tax=Dankookia sp. GCM10030260 TaxID=3273390 RepID=UPI0036172172
MQHGIRAGLAALLGLLLPAAGALAQTGTDPVARGRYLAEAADCMPCHTAPGGRPFAGGLALNTPFGAVLSPNITPDIATGIGAWTDAQFARALHDGVGRDGEDLYPVMPYTSYTRILAEDVQAIRAYLATVEPVSAPRQPNQLGFPFNIRATLGFWRELYFRPGEFRADPARPPAWNRGAYLVTALGHCGECHTPRNLLGATEPSRSLAGAVVDGWFAPNISGDLRDGVGDWPEARIADWLKTGADAAKGTAFGPMQEVVHDSLARLTRPDLLAIAAYLKDSPPRQATPRVAAVRADPRAAALYLENCGPCHQPLGRGIPGAIPPLAGNQAVTADQPNNVIQAMLHGIPAQGGYGAMPSFAAALDDRQVAAIANYVRNAWGNQAPVPATPALVAQLRQADALAAAGTEAARALCPAVSPIGAADGMAAPVAGAMALMRAAERGDIANRTGVLLADMRRANPGIGDAMLTDSLLAAYCPAVANDPTLDAAAKRQRLDQFRAGLTRELASTPATAPVLVTTALPPAALAAAQAAASRAGLSLAEWLARAATQAAR